VELYPPPSYGFTAWYLVKHTDKFIFTAFINALVLPTDHVLTDKRRLSTCIYLIRAADHDTNHCLVVEKVRGKLSASKRVNV